MHFDVEQVLWALVLAAHLVLLVVLLGRDRTGRYPWFTVLTVLSAFKLIADHLLHGKLTTLAFFWQTYATMALLAIVGILTLIELTRRVFSSGRAGMILKARGWMGWGLVTVAIAAAAVWFWGPWPAWQALKAQPGQMPILILLLTALKGQLFVGILTVELVLLMQIFGKRFGFGWRTHPQQIAVGLSTNAIGLLVLQAITELMQRNTHFTSRQEQQKVVERLNHLFTNLDNARLVLWFLVLAWWIFWLWRDEPQSTAGSTDALDETPLDSPELTLPISAETAPS